MCGFVAFLASKGTPAATDHWVRCLTDVIAHRGPDDSGIWRGDQVAVGFRRLAILDLSDDSHQPMTREDERFVLVFNGEIYNYIELRRELTALGHQFETSGDSEVLLASYRAWGEACVERLVGMFAFCIVDRVQQRLFLARDRFGIKPLYYVQSPRGVLFASEIKSIRASGLWNGQLNEARFANFLVAGRTEAVQETEDTYLAGVRQLLPGEVCTVTFGGTLTRRSYIRADPLPSVDDAHVVDGFAERFDDSIRLHLRADVPVGVLLSGGMDSVSIACSMSALLRTSGAVTPLHAFCYLSPDFDESKQITDVQRTTGAIVHRLEDLGAREVWSRMNDVMWHHDEPVHSASVLMGFELYRFAAREGIRVVLSGQGADETQGGYYHFVENLLVTLALQGRLPSLLHQASAFAEITGQSRAASLSQCARLVRAHVAGSFASYRRIAAGRRLQEGLGLAYLVPDFASRARAIADENGGQDLTSALQRATTRSPLPHYLRAEDRNSMAHSVEARVPFLDHRLVQFVSALPAQWKMWNGWNKRVMREAMTNRIPDSVRTRRQKFGFSTSVSRWLQHDLATSME
ncbi:MAG: asparagine synthase (glutamine-hydrolyzing), partial [Gemmatimonadaceae bacterium]|nr:asparagine synthase (glutamine-hydrolyzing) [Gemmatimonadaceae bacterium]